MKKSALLRSWLVGVGLPLVLAGGLWPQTQAFGAAPKVSDALNDLAQKGASDPKSVQEVLKKYLDFSRAAYEKKKFNEFSALRNDFITWLKGGSAPVLNQAVLNELEKMVKSLSSAPSGDPGLLQLVLTLNDLNSPTSRYAFISLATNPDSGLRYLAVAGIYKMLADPSTRLIESDIADLRSAALKETNGPTLTRYQMIFNALQANSPNAQDAIVKVLATRIPAWANQDAASAEADKMAVAAIRGFYPTVPAAQQQVIRATLGALLHGVVNTYIAKFKQLTEADRLNYILLIVELEKTCQTVSPDKGSVPALTEAAKAKDTEKLQLAGPQWWGEPGTRGIMEGPPWHLPPGAGLPAPASNQPGGKPATLPTSKPAT